MDVTFQLQYLTGGTWAFWGSPFTLLGNSGLSRSYSNATAGAPALTMTPINTLRMQATVRYRNTLGGPIITAVVFSPQVSYNYFGAPTANFSINNTVTPVTPTSMSVYTCAGALLYPGTSTVSGTGVMWRYQAWSSTSGGAMGAAKDVNACGWKTGFPPTSINVLSPENDPAFLGCSIRPSIYTSGEYMLVRFEVKNDCGTSSKDVLLQIFPQPSGASVNFFFRGSNAVDALQAGANNKTATGEQNPVTNSTSANDGVLSWGGTNTAPTIVGASQTNLDVSGTGFYGGVQSWTVEMYVETAQNVYSIVGSYTEPNPSNTQINIQSVPMSLGGAPIATGYFSNNFNTTASGVLGKKFKVKLIGNGVCNQQPFKEGFFTIAPGQSWWMPNGNSNGSIIQDVAERSVTEIVADLAVSPNPASDFLQLAIDSPFESESVMKVISADGQVLGSQTIPLKKGRTDVVYDINYLSSGMYYMQVVSPSSVLTKRFIKI